jgi:hypothetical protein
MTLHETELVRARWRRALARNGLDDTTRPDFAAAGLARRLRERTAHLLLLPLDPDADALARDEDFSPWLDENRQVEVEGRRISLGDQTYPTADGPAVVSHAVREPWGHYWRVQRSGAVEAGLGDWGGWERKDREGNVRRTFNLVSIVGYTWALLRLAADLRTRVETAPPWLLTVALRQTEGALLGNVGEGWAEPNDLNNHVGGCAEEHLLWHIEIAEWPDDEGMPPRLLGRQPDRGRLGRSAAAVPRPPRRPGWPVRRATRHGLRPVS